MPACGGIAVPIARRMRMALALSPALSLSCFFLRKAGRSCCCSRSRKPAADAKYTLRAYNPSRLICSVFSCRHISSDSTQFRFFRLLPSPNASKLPRGLLLHDQRISPISRRVSRRFPTEKSRRHPNKATSSANNELTGHGGHADDGKE